MAVSAAIETHQLTREFGRITALRRLDLVVPTGTIYGLIGSNGAGKTTLARILVGGLRPTSGRFRVLGGEANRPQRHIVGYMPQESALYPDLSVQENMRFFASLHGVPRLKERIRDLLARVELADRADSVVRELSGGMKRRASLAVALLPEPRLLILDEPTVGVDPILRARLWDTLRGIAEGGTTILITTHYLDEAARSDRVGMLHSGHKVDEGSPRDILAKTGTTNLEDAFHEVLRRREKGERARAAAQEERPRVPPPDKPEVRLISPGHPKKEGP